MLYLLAFACGVAAARLLWCPRWRVNDGAGAAERNYRRMLIDHDRRERYRNGLH